MTARLLGDKDLHIIRAYDKRPPAVQEQQLEDVRPQPLPWLSPPTLTSHSTQTYSTTMTQGRIFRSDVSVRCAVALIMTIQYMAPLQRHTHGKDADPN
jgi:hypothetical protein